VSILAEEGTSLVDALASAGIRPKRFHEINPIRTTCPKCKGGTEAEESLVLTIDPGSKGAVWHCHRGTCGYTENLIIGRSRGVVDFPSRRNIPVRPAPVVPESEQKRTGPLYKFFEERGIDQDTVDAFRCYLTTRWFGKKGDHEAGTYPAIVFPYYWNGVVVNRKYRSRYKHLSQEKDPQPTLFNVDSVVDPGHVVFCEGETDCMAIHQSGWKQVVTLKDGAPDKLRAEDDPKRKTDSRFDALNTHADLLQKIERFYLAGDNDPPGLVLREELARRFGRQKCWIVTWPRDCKDAGEVLQKLGQDVVDEAIQNAKPYPIEDVQEITGQALVDYLALDPPRVLTTGITALDQVISLPGEGRLIIVTGIPNAGKSQLVMAIMMHLMMREDRRFLVFSPEMQPWEEFCVMCAQILVGKPARRGAKWIEGDPIMTTDEQRAAGDWMNDRLRFLASDAEDKAPTLDWILDRGTESALRLGITDLLIDPWNEIEHQRSGMSETDYTGRSLQKIKAFCYRHGCNGWVIVHPTKMKAPAPGEALPAPGPYDINGSANFANKADVGVTVHTPNDITNVSLWKSRFQRWGRKNSSADLEFDKATGRYVSPKAVRAKHGDDAWGNNNDRK
jgi:twinkle protein